MGLRERKKEATRTALVDAAERLFGERGVDGTTMDDIAHEANTSRTSVFNYFAYKEALLVEIGARWVQEIATAVKPDRGRRSPRTLLTELADSVADLCEREPTVAVQVAREMTHPDPVRRRYAQERMGYPALYLGLLNNLASAGQLRHPKRVPSLARQLVDITSGAIVRAGGDYPVSALRTELRHNVDLFLDGALRPTP